MIPIHPKLYLGKWETEYDKLPALKHLISHVLMIGAELSPSHPKNFTYSKINV